LVRTLRLNVRNGVGVGKPKPITVE